MTTNKPTELVVTQADAIEWLSKQLEHATADLAKCEHEVAEFTGTQIGEMGFTAAWEDSRKKAELRLWRYQTLGDIVADRDEWRTQHENLLSVRQSDLASTAPASEREPENLPIRDLTIAEVIAEKARIEKLWGDFRNDEFEGHGGSPGEWMYERMNEVDTAIARLSPPASEDEVPVIEALQRPIAEAANILGIYMREGDAEMLARAVRAHLLAALRPRSERESD